MSQDHSKNTDFKNQSIMELLHSLEHIIFNLSEENFEESIERTMKLYDLKYPYSYNLTLIHLVYNAFCSKKDITNIYFKYVEQVHIKEEEINKDNNDVMDLFVNYISNIYTQESYYIKDKMIEQNLFDKNKAARIKTFYFSHYRTKGENMQLETKGPVYSFFGMFFVEDPLKTFLISNYEELSKNDWELHKKYIEDGDNTSEIAKIIRNDEIEKLQEISSQNDFDFNQTIKKSIYEKCSFINNNDVSLIDYAAFFGSSECSLIKCFKYLHINGAKIKNTWKYAIAGGNLEIIHICEQNIKKIQKLF